MPDLPQIVIPALAYNGLICALCAAASSQATSILLRVFGGHRRKRDSR